MGLFVVSPCLAGKKCRYDGKSNACPEIVRLVEQGRAIPVCPEGNLSIPRIPCEKRGDRIVDRNGRDMTEAFQRGAEEALRIALNHGCIAGILKARSPSCGVGEIYDGSFTKTRIPGNGLLADRLLCHGFALFTEENLPEMLKD